MQRDTKTPSRSGSLHPRGEELEARVCQLWFWEGFFVRRGVDLQRYYRPEPLQVTDLDLLAFEFGPTLQRRKYIGEAKSGTGRNAPAPLDRIVWLRGLMELTQADGAELTVATALSLRTRELANSLRVVAQSIRDVERREQQVHVSDVADLGSHGIAGLADQHRAHRICKQDIELERAFWFLRSEAWLLDPWLAIKRTITVLDRMSKRWVPGITVDESFALRWLLCEGVCVASLNLVTISSYAITLESDLFGQYVSDRLAEGLAPQHVMTRVADMVDKFIGAFLAQVNAPPSVQVDALGAFLPRPPDYAAPLIELTQRLANGAIYARHVPRFLDIVLFERFLRERPIPSLAVRRLGLPSEEGVARAARLVVSFLSGQANLPSIIGEGLAELAHNVSSSFRESVVLSEQQQGTKPIQNAEGYELPSNHPDNDLPASDSTSGLVGEHTTSSARKKTANKQKDMLERIADEFADS